MKHTFKRLGIATLWFSGALLLSGCGLQAQTEPVESATPVKMLQVPLSTETTGNSFVAEVMTTSEAELTFQVPGTLAQFAITMGQQVEKGQLLAALDPTDFQLAVDAREAELELATVKLRQAERLAASQLISEDSFDQAKTAYSAAKTRLEEAQTDLDYSRIHAPFSGIVALTFVNPHQYVSAKQPVLRIIELDELDLVFNLPVHLAEQLDVAALRDMPLAVNLSRFKGVTLPARFREISTQPDAETNSYQVTLTIDRPADINILPGMSGMVHVSQPNSAAQAISIPNSALIDADASDKEVWVVHPLSQRLTRVSVELDETGRLLAGLRPGDTIVAAGASSLSQDQLVKPWEREGGI